MNNALERFLQRHKAAQKKGKKHDQTHSSRRYRTLEPRDSVAYSNKKMSIQSLQSKSKIKHRASVNLPKLQSRLITVEQKLLKNYKNSKKKNSFAHFGLIQMNPPEPLRLRRSQSACSSSKCMSIPSGRLKPTDKFFGHKQNIRLVEKLLMMKPTNGMSSSQHKQFYKQQTKYRKNIQITKSGSIRPKRSMKKAQKAGMQI